MQEFDYQPTTRVVFGENALSRVADLVTELGAGKVLIVTDHGLAQSGHLDRTTALLEDANIAWVAFKEVEENPNSGHVQQGVKFARQHGEVDLIIGLGGGSAMDCAKGINFLLTNGGKMEDYWGVGKATKPMLPSIGIPTTAGTGSEAQSFALIVNEETYQKMACGDIKARFRSVILDPSLLATVPRKVAAVTGIDAIAHALESHVCTRRNAVSQIFSQEAWRLLSANFLTFIAEPENLSAAGHMLLGAHLAGQAIENAMLGAAHACANPLTAHFDITHGVAVGLMLPHVIEYNADVVNGDYTQLLQAGSIPGAASTDGLHTQITELLKAVQLPVNLRDCHISQTELPELAAEAAQQWTSQFNPREVGEKELLDLYEKAF